MPGTALHLLPQRVRSGPILANRTTLDRLPQLVSWPNDGGPFVTLPQVYTEDPDRPGLARSNLGMYRVQLSGNDYEPNREVGLHYQIHRGIGVHHAAAIRRGEPLEGQRLRRRSAGLDGGGGDALARGLARAGLRRGAGRASDPDGQPRRIAADAGRGRFRDLRHGRSRAHRSRKGRSATTSAITASTHDFPVLRVDRVYHRHGAIWPFTSVGRPPQEDTSFGALIHELTGPLIPTVLPGVHAVHAVDAAGVHPLLLAIGSERYVPYAEVRRPQELLTQANAILGQGQMSLAKYLLIVAREDDPRLDIHDIPAFLRHLLERVDWSNDLHFQTRTTIDTLDYSGHGFNQGSKVVIAARDRNGETCRRNCPADSTCRTASPSPGSLCRACWSCGRRGRGGATIARSGTSAESFAGGDPIGAFPWIVLVDDSEFAAGSLRNFLWVTFTRSDPAADIDGIGAFVDHKHWGCRGPLVIDARIKPHHAPPLEDDPEVERRVDSLGAPGGPLHGIL